MRLAGAVLAGGASRRMGRDKASIDVDGTRMIDRVLHAVAGAGGEPIMVVGGSDDLVHGTAAAYVPDLHPGDGPLGGILTALREASTLDVDAVLAVSCDLPLLTPQALAPLVTAAAESDQGEVVVARSEGIEPMCAIWPVQMLDRIADRFDAGERAVHRLLATLDVVEVGVETSALRNVNTPGDLEDLSG